MSRCFVFLYMLSLLSLSSSDANYTLTYQNSTCSNTTTFTPNSAFQTNRNLLLSYLSSNASRIINRFYNFSVGRDPPNIAYGNFICKPDLTTSHCQECMKKASTNIVQHCPIEKEAFIVYDQGILRFSNRYFFSIMEDKPTRINGSNGENISEDPKRQMKLVLQTMNDLATQAAYNKSHGEKFAVSAKPAPPYSLVQCTPDLSGEDSEKCLRKAISLRSSCCSGKIGGRLGLCFRAVMLGSRSTSSTL